MARIAQDPDGVRKEDDIGAFGHAWAEAPDF
jgi:hypothetical protein